MDQQGQALWEEMSSSVVCRLKHLEDKAVTKALTKQQQEAEEQPKLKLEAQARTHQEAMEAEWERKSDAAQQRLRRAHLGIGPFSHILGHLHQSNLELGGGGIQSTHIQQQQLGQLVMHFAQGMQCFFGEFCLQFLQGGIDHQGIFGC